MTMTHLMILKHVMIVKLSDDCEIIEKVTGTKDNSEARRRLEKVLEDKALERLINDDFYN